METLSAEQLKRVQLFAFNYGKNWKAKLLDLWQSGRDVSEPDGHLLRQVRNYYGPRWLAGFTIEYCPLCGEHAHKNGKRC